MNCLNCNNQTNFNTTTRQYRKFCSHVCHEKYVQKNIQPISCTNEEFLTHYHITIQNKRNKAWLRNNNTTDESIILKGMLIYLVPNINTTYRQKLWIVEHSLKDAPLCQYEGCIKNAHWNKSESFYQVGCCHMHGVLCESSKQKYKDVILAKYGTRNVMQNTDVGHRNFSSNKRRKLYTLPSGKEVYVQGYEPTILDYLVKELKYNENDIILGIVNIEKHTGRLNYMYNDKVHRYYPDMYIKSENKIVEVKSKYTFNNYKEQNLLKQQMCLDKGFKFEFFILTQNNITKRIHE